MLRKVEAFLDSITMYKLVLYILLFAASYAWILSFFSVVSFSPLQALLSFVVLYEVCKLSNVLFAWVFSAPRNIESAAITSLILFLIIDPRSVSTDLSYLILAGVLAMGSKYLLAIKGKHIFNPAAISLFILGLVGFGGGTWWVGSKEMLPVALLSLLVVVKIRKKELFWSFLLAAFGSIALVGLFNSENLLELISQTVISWPVVFFAGIMLTEPLTSPNRKRLQVIFGLIVGVLFGSRFSFGPIYSTPELALVIGNIFTFLVTANTRVRLILKEIKKLSPTILEFVFHSERKVPFVAGQFAEVTLPHSSPDSRGNRRYFTIASSPEEEEIRFGLRVDLKRSSSFKQSLQKLEPKDSLYLTQVGGDFLLPNDASEKLVFIAGGVGITPFVAIIKDLLIKKQKRDIVLFYLVKDLSDFVYKSLLEKAEKEMGLKLVLIVSDNGNRFTTDIFKKEAVDYTERTIYVSGSNSMVQMTKDVLQESGVGLERIKTDYFSGY